MPPTVKVGDKLSQETVEAFPGAQMAMNTLLVIALVSVFIAVIVVIVRPHPLAHSSAHYAH